MISRQQWRQTVFIVLFALATGLIVAFTPYYDTLNADTTVEYLNSMVRWTPFFWGQDRYGMLIPALTLMIKDPLANVIAQNVLHVFCSAVSFFLLARFLFPGRRHVEIGLVALAGYFGLSGLPEIKDYLTPWQIYTPAMAFGLAAVLIPRRRGLWTIALPLAMVAEWCNFAVCIWIGLLVVGRAIHRRPDFRDLFRQSLIWVAACSFGLWLKSHSSNAIGYYGPLPLREAALGWLRLLADYRSYLPRTTLWLPIVPPVVGLTVLSWHACKNFDGLKRSSRPILHSVAVGILSAFLYAVIVGASAFAKFNSYNHRYLIPSFMIWMVTWAGLSVHLMAPSLHGRRLWAWRAVLSMLFPVLLIGRLGVPSLSAVKASIAKRYEPLMAQIPASCTHMLGDYYRVWDSVFYARLQGRALWGITYRATAIRDLWDFSHFKEPRICYWRDNQNEALRILAAYHLGRFQVVGSFSSASGGPGIVELKPASSN